MTCTFFGHKEAPEEVKPLLRETIIDLIENHGANEFYVGNNGHFDGMAASVLKELKQIYPNIEYHVVLAYLRNDSYKDEHPTEFPEGIETVPKKFAIDFRNKWMVAKADTVIVYINHGWGGAAKFAGQAKRKKKTVINISGSNIEL